MPTDRHNTLRSLYTMPQSIDQTNCHNCSDAFSVNPNFKHNNFDGVKEGHIFMTLLSVSIVGIESIKQFKGDARFACSH